MAFCLFLFIYSILLSLIYTYIPSVCNFFTSGFVGCQFFCNQFFISLTLVSSICKCVTFSNRKKNILFIYILIFTVISLVIYIYICVLLFMFRYGLILYIAIQAFSLSNNSKSMIPGMFTNIQILCCKFDFIALLLVPMLISENRFCYILFNSVQRFHILPLFLSLSLVYSCFPQRCLSCKYTRHTLC